MALALALSMEVSGAQHLAELQTAAVQRVTVSEGRPGGVSLLKQLSSGSYEYDELEVCIPDVQASALAHCVGLHRLLPKLTWCPVEHQHCLTSSQLHRNGWGDAGPL